jgi:hypothetical protein
MSKLDFISLKDFHEKQVRSNAQRPVNSKEAQTTCPSA